MQLVNKMIQGVRNWIVGDTPENRGDDRPTKINHHILPPSSQVTYRSRQEALDAAKAEIDARLK